MLFLVPIILTVTAPSPPKASPSPPPRTSAVDLYSPRARRRAAALLRLELLELRERDLERVRDAIRRQLPVDTLLQGTERGTR